MAGIPPTIGFYAKFTVLQAAWQAGFTWAVVLAVLMAVVGVFYYLRIVKLMYFDDPKHLHNIYAPIDMQFVLSINTLALLLLGMLPQVLMNISGLSIVTSLQ
jgi:NADH-quinone oxidoreductase subunit N